jgi:hypothetical protein
MADIFVEKMVKKKRDGKDFARIALCVLLVVSCDEFAKSDISGICVVICVAGTSGDENLRCGI